MTVAGLGCGLVLKELLLVLGEERRNLQYALLYNLLNRHVELVVRHLQHVVEYTRQKEKSFLYV